MATGKNKIETGFRFNWDSKDLSGDLIPGSVTQIQSQFKFLLTANDQASGTSRFDIIEQPIPEPGTLLLVGSGVLTAVGLLRRRRMQ